MFYSKIIGLGHYLPELVVTNEELAPCFGVDPDWIEERTGIKERRYVIPGKDTPTSMGTYAALQALQRAGLTPADVSLIVFATQASEYHSPSCAYEVQYRLGLAHTPVIDVRGQCSGFLQALSVADQFVKTGMFKTVLIIASEMNSCFMNRSPVGKDVASIFGDGAGAVIIQQNTDPGNAILSTHLHAQGEHREHIHVSLPIDLIADENGWLVQRSNPRAYNISMNGKAVFRYASQYLPEVINEALAFNNLKQENIDHFFFHQANLRIIKAVEKRMQLPESKVYTNVQYLGNVSSASIPVCLSQAWEKNIIKPNDLLCLASFGSGFTWASSIVRL